MECSEADRLLSLSIDRELDGRSELLLAEHQANCAACRTQRQRMESLRASVRQGATYHRAPTTLREHLRGDRAKVAAWQPQRIGWRWLPTAAALRANGGWVASALLGIALAFVVVSHRSEHGRIADELITAHARAVTTGHLLDVASSDQHTVKPWFSSRLDFSPPVRDFAEQGFPLVGGRIDYADHRAVAVLVYRRRQHLIDVFVEPAQAGASTSAPLEVDGFNVVVTQRNGLSFRAVSDVDAEELTKLLELL